MTEIDGACLWVVGKKNYTTSLGEMHLDMRMSEGVEVRGRSGLTVCTLIEGKRFWKSEAMSLT